MTQFDPNRPISMEKPPATAQVVPYNPMGAPVAQPGFGVAPPPVPMYGQPPVPAYGQPSPYPTVTTVAPQQSNVEIIVAWIFTAITLLYMLPWAIAASRRSTNSILIAIGTFFLAWTVLGWLVMLVLSFLGPTVYSVRSTTIVTVPPPAPAGTWAQCPTDPPNVRRWWDGRAWTSHTTTG